MAKAVTITAIDVVIYCNGGLSFVLGCGKKEFFFLQNTEDTRYLPTTINRTITKKTDQKMIIRTYIKTVDIPIQLVTIVM